MTAAVPSWSVAGWGDPATGLPYRLRPAHTGTAGATVSPVIAMAEWPGTISTRLDLAESWVESSSYTVEVARIDELAAAAALRSFLWQSRPDPLGYLTTAIDDNDTSVAMTIEPGVAIPAAPFNLYLGREVLRVTAVGGSSPSYTLTVTRGMYGTEAVAHGVAALDDVVCYQVNPLVTGREVVVYEYVPADDEETPIWRGLLEEPDLGDGLGVMALTARDAWGYLHERQVGEGRWSGEFRVRRLSGSTSDAPPTEIALTEGPRERPSETGLFARLDDVQHVAMAIGEDSIAAVRVETVYTTPREAYRIAGSVPVGSLLYGSPLPEDDERAAVRELMVVDLESGLSLVRDEDGGPSAHPLDVWRSILRSTGTATWPSAGSLTEGSGGDFDTLPSTWGAGIPGALFNDSAINTVRDRLLYRDLSARGFVLGADEEKLPDLKTITKRLLKPAGLVPAFDSQYRYTVVGLDDPGADAVDVAITVADLAPEGDGDGAPIAVKMQPWSSLRRYRRIRMRVARVGLSDRYGETILDTDFAEVIRTSHPFGAPTLEIDAGDYGDPVTHALSAVDRDALTGLGALRLDVLRDRLPEYVLSLRPGVQALPAGSTIALTLGVLLNGDGNRGVANHRCLVIEGRRDPYTRIQTIRCLDLYPLTRASELVAPSWRIASVSSDTEFTISANEFSTDDPAWFATATSDAQLELYDRTGVLRSTDGSVIGSVVGSTVTLDDAWTASSVAVTPAAGDVVEIASYDNAAGAWDGYCWIADTSATLGAAGDAASRWGH